MTLNEALIWNIVEVVMFQAHISFLCFSYSGILQRLFPRKPENVYLRFISEEAKKFII